VTILEVVINDRPFTWPEAFVLVAFFVVVGAIVWRILR
jgi:hypothetical protein